MLRRIRHGLWLLWIAIAVPVLADPPAAEQAADDPAAIETNREPVACVTTNRLRRAFATDERTLMFVTRAEIYLNALRYACPGLERGDTFSYRVYGGRIARLCRGDLVYPHVESTVGCSLGEFHEISMEQARALLSPVEAWQGDQAVTVAPRPLD